MAFNPKASFDLARFTAFGIGGPARWVAEVHSLEDLQEGWRWAQARGLSTLFAGEGSNILFPDSGFDGLLLINRIGGIQMQSPDAASQPASGWDSRRDLPQEPAPRYVRVGGGVNLMELIRWCHRQRLSGLERMYGIPGTVAGAVVGNAGAYGQQMQDTLVEASVWSAGRQQVLPHEKLCLRYRHSVLKENRDCFLVDVLLRLGRSEENLQHISENILQTRTVKYPPGMKCPGSFFKNVEVAALPARILERVPPEFVMQGKIPAGRLLEAVGACGAHCGDAKIATYHGNLFVNLGAASADDVLKLAVEYSGRVYDRFGICLEAEVLIVGGDLCAPC